MTPAHCFLLALEAIKWPSENINLRRSVSVFRQASFGEILALMRCPKISLFYKIFLSGSCFEHSGAQLNMGQSDSINNRTVKFVISYQVVFKQVEVFTILALVKSWLHAGTYPVSIQ